MFRVDINCEFDDPNQRLLAVTVEELLTRHLRDAGAINISIEATRIPPRRTVLEVVKELIAEGDFESLDTDVQINLIRERL